MDESSPPTRLSRARATLRDLVELLGALVLACVVATAWLLGRTHWGRDDAQESDAILAVAVVLAVSPVWFLRYAASSLRQSSPGERALNLEVMGPRRRRIVRLALHPLALPGWASLALLFAAAGAPALGVMAAAVGVLVAIGGLVSIARLVTHPTGPAVHDWIAGTRLHSRGQPGSLRRP